MDSKRKASSGLSGGAIKFSALRDTGDEQDDLGGSSPSSSPPRASSTAAAAPNVVSTSAPVGGGGSSFEDFLKAVPPARQQPRPPSAFAKSSSHSPPPPPPPPASQPPTSSGTSGGSPSSTASSPAKMLTRVPPEDEAEAGAPPETGVEADEEDTALDTEEEGEEEGDDTDGRSPVADSSEQQQSLLMPAKQSAASTGVAASARAELWPFVFDKQQQQQRATPRVVRTDAPPPNPLERKFPLLFTLITAALAIVCSAPLPLPDLAKGLVIGSALTCCLLVYFYLEFLAQYPVIVHYTGAKYCKNPRASVAAATLVTAAVAAPSSSRSRQQQQQQSSQRLDGFLNESWSYDVERHHLNHTFTVYAALEGRHLTLRRPQQPVPKRVLYSDNPPALDSLVFSDAARQFDLQHARLRLQPEGLVRKRLWSKKYPIHVTLTSASDAASAPAASGPAGFESVRRSDCVQRELYLFARTSREKELWYRRLYAACNGLPQPEALFKSVTSAVSSHQQHHHPALTIGDQAKRYAEYAAAFSRFADISEVQLGSADKPELNFLNALLQRATWDVFKTPYWADLIKVKMDARLKKIRLPYFIEELSVADVHVGSALPTLRRLHKPHVNERGLWFHLDIDYPGGCSASLVTRINLHRLQDRGGASAASGSTASTASAPASAAPAAPRPQDRAPPPRKVSSSASADSISAMSAAGNCPFSDAPTQRLAATNSELEDSGESTTDESGQSDPEPEADDPALGNVGGKHSRKVIKFIDKVAQSEKFHHLLGKYKFLQKAVDSVSNTKILLSVDVHSLRGTLVLNLPFPPSDRVWAAFHPVPQLVLTSRPKIGEKEFSARKISDIISKKLITEFHRVFVLPNMEDFYLPTLNSDEALLASSPAAAAGAAAAAAASATSTAAPTSASGLSMQYSSSTSSL